MGAEAQHVEQSAVEFAEWPIDARGEDRVVEALPAQGAIGEFRRERRVAR